MENQKKQEKEKKQERKTILDISRENPHLAFTLKNEFLPKIKEELIEENNFAYLNQDYETFLTTSYELYALEKLEKTNNILCFVSNIFNPEYDYKISQKHHEYFQKNKLDKWIIDWLENKTYRKIKRKFFNLAIKYKQLFHPLFSFVETDLLLNAIRRKKIYFIVVNRKIFASLYAPI